MIVAVVIMPSPVIVPWRPASRRCPSLPPADGGPEIPYACMGIVGQQAEAAAADGGGGNGHDWGDLRHHGLEDGLDRARKAGVVEARETHSGTDRGRRRARERMESQRTPDATAVGVRSDASGRRKQRPKHGSDRVMHDSSLLPSSITSII